MNVGELKKALDAFPDDMEVIRIMYSDYRPMTAECFEVTQGVYQESCGYIMRSHRTMSEENKKKEKSYLVFDGN